MKKQTLFLFLALFFTLIFASWGEVTQKEAKTSTIPNPPSLSSDSSYITLCTSPDKKYAIILVRAELSHFEREKGDYKRLRPIEYVPTLRFIEQQNPRAQWPLDIQFPDNDGLTMLGTFSLYYSENNTQTTPQTSPKAQIYTLRMGEKIIEKWKQFHGWKPGDYPYFATHRDETSSISKNQGHDLASWKIKWSPDSRQFLLHFSPEGDTPPSFNAYTFLPTEKELHHLSYDAVDQAHQKTLNKRSDIRQPWANFYLRERDTITGGDLGPGFVRIQEAYFKEGDIYLQLEDNLTEKTKENSKSSPTYTWIGETLQFHFNPKSYEWEATEVKGTQTISHSE